MNYHATVIIPTYKRAHLITQVLESLVNQSYKDFDVIVILKPSGDGTENIVEYYKKKLNIELIINKGYVARSYNLGLKRARGDIVAFLDDDTIPTSTWLEEHLKEYMKDKQIGGMSGPVKPAIINKKGKLEFIKLEKNWSPHNYLARRTFRKPLKYTEEYVATMSISGAYVSRPLPANVRRFLSLCFNGGNMSFRSKALKGEWIDENTIKSLWFENYLAYMVCRKGYRCYQYLKGPTVFHVSNHTHLSLSRSSNWRDETLLELDRGLMFFKFKKSGAESLSYSAYITFLLVRILESIIETKRTRLSSLGRIVGIIYSLPLGMKYLTTNDIYRPNLIPALEKLVGKWHKLKVYGL